MYVRFLWLGKYQIIYGHIRCIYMVLANPTRLRASFETLFIISHCVPLEYKEVVDVVIMQPSFATLHLC